MISTEFLLVTLALAGTLNPSTASVTLKEGDNALSAAFRLCEDKARGRITVALDGGAKHVFALQIEPDHARRKVVKDGKTGYEDVPLPDAAIQVSGLARYYSRPRIQRYTAPQQEGLIARWASLPAASKRFVTFEARQDEAGVALYLDGQYVGRRDAKGRLASLVFDLPKEGEVRDATSLRRETDGRYLPLPLAAIARPGAMKAAAVSPAPGRRTIEGVPLDVVGGSDSIDVGVVKEMKGSWALECDEHLARTALDGMPETAHFAVPQAYYSRAWALCAVDGDPNRDPIITARLTRFAGSGRGDAISDTTIELPRGESPPPPGVRRVGTITYAKAGRQTTVPLWLVEFVLKPGEILDLLSMDADPRASMTRQPYLDFELLGKLDGLTAQWDRRHKPDRKSTSAVHVFGVTLERGPVAIRLQSAQPGNLFHNDEKPELTATLKANRPGRVSLGWAIRDVEGSAIRQDQAEFAFAAAGEEKTVTIPLTADKLGWYGLDLTVREDGGREVLRHEAAFALLGRDTRNAGYESPYGTWWFAGAHYGAEDKEVAGPMLFKAGLRKTTFGWTKYTEADMAAWKLTLNQLGWGLAPKDLAHPQAAYDEAEKKVREQLDRFPHCRWADIFHESYAHYVPAELLDGNAAADDPDVEATKKRAELGAFAARFYRERFPQIKLLVGNTSSSASIIASLFRGGFDAKYIDYIGVEAVGQTCMPEKLWEGGTQGIWLAREVARKFGHDLPVTGCFEFTARVERNLGPRRHAEWIARDMLLCHAYGFQHINPAILHDAGNAYFNSLWGAGGLCRRNPLLYPKPAYVAVATLTGVLDQVKLLGRLPTGSTTVYALQFQRADGQFACALWTARGQADLRLRFGAKTEAARVGCYGEAARLAAGADGDVTVSCGTAPAYVVASAPVSSIQIVARKFAGPPASFRVADAMDDPARWQLAPGDEKLRQPTPRGLPCRAPGEFDLTAENDADKGRCLQLKGRRGGKLPDVMGEYTALRLARPLAVEGTPTGVGLSVRGDSGWGQIIFELQDAVGATWRTDGVWHDWPGDLSICHDGWRFMGFPIDGSSDVPNISPGARWTSASPTKKAAIQFPVKLTGLIVVMQRKALDLTEMKEAPGVLRLRDLGTWR